MSLVQVDVRPGPVVVVTMDDDARRNTLSLPMLAELEAALVEAERLGARAVVLRARPGAGTWCAGFDIAALPAQGPQEWAHPMDRLLAQIGRAHV